ncbi:alcohol dehydrogenase catalytic domain-containing protein, partial [Sneathiella sp.]|uniref:alcohol dehydrogenase catalytic domain-containing protein n=1 Tax=Sneathiella sp. TaxID=1964365 RepID=UPI0026347C60
MKALVCKEFGDPDILVMEDVPEPEVKKGMVKIEVHSVGLNFPDTLMIAGKYQFKPPFPFSPGMESSGIVTAVGEG